MFLSKKIIPLTNAIIKAILNVSVTFAHTARTNKGRTQTLNKLELLYRLHPCFYYLLSNAPIDFNLKEKAHLH